MKLKKLSNNANSGPQAALVLTLSGIGLGAAHLDPFWSIGAWLSIVLMAFAFHLSEHRGWLVFGVLVGGFASHWLGHPWYLESVYNWGGQHWPLWKVTLMWILSTFIPMVLPDRLFLILAVLIPKRRLVPIFIWLPLAWWLGELLTLSFSGLCQNFWLYSQWQMSPVLRTVGHLGWTPAFFFCFFVASLFGEALYLRSFKRFALATGSGLIIFLLPSLPSQKETLTNIGAVYMQNYVDFPRAAPSETKLLVWPEVSRSGRPRIKEGLNQNLKFYPPFPSTTHHIIGQETRIKEGLQNSLLAMTPQGTISGVRAKRMLFPGNEKPFFGYQLSHRYPYIAGKAPPYLDINGKRITALLCLEEFDRYLAYEGKNSGANLIAISAIDKSLTTNELVYRQFLGISVLLAVDLGLPLVRSSLGGPAAFIDSDGTVLTSSPVYKAGILTLSKDWSLQELNDLKKSKHHTP